MSTGGPRAPRKEARSRPGDDMTATLDLKEITEKWGSEWKEFRETHKKELDEIKKNGSALGETKERMDKLQDALDATEKKWQDAVQKLEQRIATPKADGGGKKDVEPTEAERKHAAWLHYARKGADSLAPEERKDLISSDDSAGGYLAPSEFRAEMIKSIVEFSPVRSVARVVPTSAKSVKWPKRTTSASATWVSEVGTRSETTNPAFGVEEIPTHEVFARTDVSLELLEDSMFNLEQFLREEYGEQFGVSEGTAFVKGSGVGQPQGIVAAGNGLLSVTGADTTGHFVVANEFIDTFYTIKDSYSRNGLWMLNRLMIRNVRKYTFSLSGETVAYVWQPGLGGEPPTLLGRPYVEAPDLDVDTATAPAAGRNVALFGDWRRCYVVVDRVQISLLRDPYTLQDNGLVKMTARKRVGGQVVLGEAGVKLVTG